MEEYLMACDAIEMNFVWYVSKQMIENEIREFGPDIINYNVRNDYIIMIYLYNYFHLDYNQNHDLLTISIVVMITIFLYFDKNINAIHKE